MKCMSDPIAEMNDEFVPSDFLECLRYQLDALKKRSCPKFEVRISRFREAIMQITDMSELDKITLRVNWFVPRLKKGNIVGV